MIPKLFHQVWLGWSPPTENVLRYQKKLLSLHPKWELMVWTEKNIPHLPFFNIHVYNALFNFAEKSDYFRFLLVYTYGWVYLDTDIEFIKNLDPLVQNYDFFIGQEALLNNTSVRINNGLFGAVKNSPIIKEIIFLMNNKILSGDIYETSSEKLGPWFITPIILAKESTKVCIFAPDYFHPVPWWHKTDKDYVTFLTSNTYSIHHFLGSWKKKNLYYKIIFFSKKYFYKVKRKLSL